MTVELMEAYPLIFRLSFGHFSEDNFTFPLKNDLPKSTKKEALAYYRIRSGKKQEIQNRHNSPAHSLNLLMLQYFS